MNQAASHEAPGHGREDSSYSREAPIYSIVVAHDRRAGEPGELAAALARLPGPAREVICVAYGPPASGSPAGSRDPLYSGQARALGLERSRGRVVVFLEPDCQPPPDFLERLERGLADPRVAGLGGAWRAWDQDNPAAGLAEVEFAFGAQGLEELEHPVLFAFCAAFKRERLRAAGGPEPREGDGGGALVSMCRRLAARDERLLFDPELVARRRRPNTWPDLAREEFRRGWEMFAARRQRAQDPGPPPLLPRGVPAQVILALGSVGVLAALITRAPQNALTLAALCLLLLYPLNRSFLHFVAGRRPGLVNRAIILCLARPFLWAAGLAAAALDRLAKGA